MALLRKCRALLWGYIWLFCRGIYGSFAEVSGIFTRNIGFFHEGVLGFCRGM